MQYSLVAVYRCFRTDYEYHLQVSMQTETKTSIIKYQSTLYKNPKQ